MEASSAENDVLEQPPRLYTIPLIPHNEHRRRRRLLQTTTTTTSNATITTSNATTTIGANVSSPSTASTKRPQQYQRRAAIASSQQQQQTVRLFQGLGTHYIDIWCGTPPQRQTVIVDTGSSVTAFPCTECTTADYHHIDEPFRHELSSTFREPTCDDCTWGECSSSSSEDTAPSSSTSSSSKCTYTANYQEGSNWTAVEVMDQCYIGGMHTVGLRNNPRSFELRFGCQTQISGDFVTQLADGIMGMDIGGSAIWNQMFEQRKLESRAFSLCFQRRIESERRGTESGAMTMGGTDPRLHSHTMVYSTTEPGSLYAVQLRMLYLRKGGGEHVLVGEGESPVIIPVPLPEELNEPGKRHVIVDSGTTDSYFSYLLKEPFEKIWLEVVGRPYTNDPTSMTEEQLQMLPTFLFQFVGWNDNDKIASVSPMPLARDLDPDHPNDILVAVPPSHYMEYQEENRGYVAGFYWDEPEGIVIGANVMMKHDILFDVQNSRIGWAESDCNYTDVGANDDQEAATTYVSPTSRRYRTQQQQQQPIQDQFGSLSSSKPFWPGLAISSILLSLVCLRVLLLRRSAKSQAPVRSTFLLKSSSYAIRTAPVRRGSRRVARRTVSEMQVSSLPRPSKLQGLDPVSETKPARGVTRSTSSSIKRGSVLRSRSHQRDSELFEMVSLVEESS